MSKEREFLKKLRYASLLENDLRKELEELLAQPEQEPVATKLESHQFTAFHVSADDFKKLQKLPTGTKIYTAPPKREQEQHGTQYLLDQVSMLRAENAMLKEKWLAQPEQTERITFKDDADKIAHLENSVELLAGLLDAKKREPLSDEEITKAFLQSDFGAWDGKSYWSGIRDAEKAHGIGENVLRVQRGVDGDELYRLSFKTI